MARASRVALRARLTQLGQVAARPVSIRGARRASPGRAQTRFHGALRRLRNAEDARVGHAFAVGFGLGFLVALQLGPISLYLIRTTLRNGWEVGVAFALGIAVVDLGYAALGAAGVAPLLAIGPLETILGLLGAAVLV